jgi:hypothetical protein
MTVSVLFSREKMFPANERLAKLMIKNKMAGIFLNNTQPVEGKLNEQNNNL